MTWVVGFISGFIGGLVSHMVLLYLFKRMWDKAKTEAEHEYEIR